MLTDLIRDLRHGLRALARNRRFAAAGVLILTLGIGANATIFTLIDALFRQPPPRVQAPEELVQILRMRQDFRSRWHCFPSYLDYRDRNRVFSALAAFDASGVAVTVGMGDDHRQTTAWLVSSNYFDVLGVEPSAGRSFLPAEGQVPGRSTVALISYRFWQSAFGGDPGSVGSRLRLNGQPFTIVGVIPEGFRGTSPLDRPPDLWLPLTVQPLMWPDASALRHLPDDHTWWLQLIGRLAPGVSLEQAEAEIRGLTRRIVEDQPDLHRDQQAGLSGQFRYGPGTRSDLGQLFRLLAGAVALVLLIACANIAILQLARASVRGREMCLRVALGAKPGRLARQLLAESLLLATAGGVGGYLLATWTTELTAGLLPYRVVADFSPDASVLAFAMSLALVTALLFSLAPIYQTTRHDVVAALELGRHGAPRHSLLRQTLVVLQVAVSVVLVSGAMLLARSLWRAQEVDLGFATDRRAVLQLDLRLHGYDAPSGQRLIRTALDRLARLPGVSSATTTSTLPFELFWDDVVNAADHGEAPVAREGLLAQINAVGPNYFETLEIPLIAGRGFDLNDDANAPRVAVINRAAAEDLWPGGAVGETLLYGSPVERYAVVGVAGDTAQVDLGPARPAVYFSVLQEYSPELAFIVLGRSQPEALAEAARGELLSLDSGLAMSRIEPLADVFERQIRPYRTSGLLIGVFGVLALALASTGVFGVLSFLVAQRRREIGIRVALGADRQRVARSIVGHGLRLTLIGIALGAIGAQATSRFWRSLLYGVEPHDPLSALGAASILLAVAWAASSIPASRASRVEPVAVLHQE